MSIYLNVPGIAGESTAANFSKWFGLSSVTWGGANTASLTGGGRTSFTSVSITKNSVLRSPSLMLAMAQQAKLGTVMIAFTTIIAGQELPVVLITLTNAVMNSYSQTLEPGSPPSEVISFIFSKVDYKHTAYDSSGKVITSDDHFWDVVANGGK